MTSSTFRRNIAWVAERTSADPDFFKDKFHSIAPKILWIGCSDNPAPSLEIGAFDVEGCLVHRNLGNQVSAHDASLVATLGYALQAARVERIIVCGPYGCNCLRGVLHETLQGVGDCWINPIRTLYKQNRRQLDTIVSEEAQIQALCELNVRMQVRSLAEHPLVEASLGVGSLKIEGVMWSPRDGLLRDPGIVVGRAPRHLKPDRLHKRM